jgi:enamine deaminase RidA (YjgF/YER057c/UK114 family)
VDRRLVSSGSPYEPLVGFSRAVRVGSQVFVAGTAPIMPEGADPPADAYGQAKRCFEIVVKALDEAGAAAEDVVRTRIYLTRAEDWQEAGRAHGEVFASIRPANAIIVVRGFVDPRWLVEVEVDAVVTER